MTKATSDSARWTWCTTSPRTERLLDEDIESKLGFPVTVKCGTGLKIVPVGDSFTCTAVDRQSVEKTVEVTVEEVGKDSWRIVD